MSWSYSHIKGQGLERFFLRRPDGTPFILDRAERVKALAEYLGVMEGYRDLAFAADAILREVRNPDEATRAWLASNELLTARDAVSGAIRSRKPEAPRPREVIAEEIVPVAARVR